MGESTWWAAVGGALIAGALFMLFAAGFGLGVRDAARGCEKWGFFVEDDVAYDCHKREEAPE